MIKNYIKLYLTRKITVRNGMFYGHTKLFNANSELAAPCTFYRTAAQCSISQHAFRAQCRSYSVFQSILVLYRSILIMCRSILVTTDQM